MPERTPQRGFTLIELMVVVAIIAILVGAVVVNLTRENPGRVVNESAQRTALLMELAADQAVYARRQLGVRFHPDSYEFYLLEEPGAGDEESSGESDAATVAAGTASSEPEWVIVPDERFMFRKEGVPIEFQLDISGVPVVLESLEEELRNKIDDEPLKPHVMFLSNGEVFPDFRLIMRDRDGEYEYQIATGEESLIELEALE